jgi:hypothetical protein
MTIGIVRASLDDLNQSPLPRPFVAFQNVFPSNFPTGGIE